MEYLYIILFLIGLLGGLLSGLFGIGGGVIYIVILAEYFHLYPCENMTETQQVLVIIANSLFAIFFSGLSGTIKQYLSKNFYPKIFIPLGLMASLSSVLTSYLLTNVHYDKKIFVLFLSILIITLSLRNVLEKQRDMSDKEKEFTGLKKIVLGIGLGIIVALTGLGGGAVLVPVLSVLVKMDYKKAISISLGFILITSFFTTVYNFLQNTTFASSCGIYIGMIKPDLVLPMVIGIMIATPFGVSINQRLSDKNLKLGFMIFTFIIISRMIYTTFTQ